MWKYDNCGHEERFAAENYWTLGKKMLPSHDCFSYISYIIVPWFVFRENGKLSTYGNAESARAGLLRTLKQKSANYASFCRKPEFCNSDNSKQTTAVNQR